MKVIKTMRPGDRGTHRFQRTYGDRLCAVRYRTSPCGTKTLTTVEIIADEREKALAGVCHNRIHSQRLSEPVALRIAYEEFDVREKVKRAGGRWSAVGRAWVVRREIAIGLELAHRIMEGVVEECVDIDTSFEI